MNGLESIRKNKENRALRKEKFSFKDLRLKLIGQSKRKHTTQTKNQDILSQEDKHRLYKIKEQHTTRSLIISGMVFLICFFILIKFTIFLFK